MPSQFRLDVPEGLGELIESIAQVVIQSHSSAKTIPEDQWIYQTACDHLKKLIEIRHEAQSGLSPSSTEEYTNKAPIVVQAGDRKASEGDVSTDRPPEEPESNDTSYGVEATAIRTLAASTGTVAILGTTAKTKDSGSGNEENDENDETSTNAGVEETSPTKGGEVEKKEEIAAVEETVVTNKSEDEIISSGEIDEGVKIVEELNKIVDAESAQKDLTPENSANDIEIDSSLKLIENENSVSDRASINGNGSKEDDLKESISEITLIAVDIKSSGDVVVDKNQPSVNDSEKQAEVEADLSAHSQTHEEDDNDISSEQLKTNSLSDISISEMEEKPEMFNTEVVKESEPKTVDENPKEIQTRVQIETTEDNSEANMPESLVKITLDEPDTPSEETESNQEESIPLTEEPQIQKENSTKILDAAATTIQSNFRGYQVRKTLKNGNDDFEGMENPKLTDSLIENARVEVDEIIKEAEVKTESLINSPVTDEFPAPPEDMLLEARKIDEVTQVVTDVVSAVVNEVSSHFNEEPVKPVLQNKSENSVSELARMTADEDLPAPDFEMLESSSTDDINTEIINTSLKGTEDELRDSTEGDLTLDENSEKVKEPARAQEYSELKQSPSAISDVQPENTPSQDTTSSLLSQDLLEDDNVQIDANGPVEEVAKDNSINQDPNESVQKVSDPSNGESLQTISTESAMTFEHSNNITDSVQGSFGNTNLSEGPVHDSADNSNLSGEDPAHDSAGNTNLSEDSTSNAVDVAATKIQAHVRGYLARKHIDNENKTDSAGEVDTVVEISKQPEAEIENSEIMKNEAENSETTCESKTNGTESEETAEDRTKRKLDIENEVNEKKINEPVDEKLINNSAAKIQAGVRGFLVRKRQKTIKESPKEVNKGEKTTVKN